MSSKKPVKKHQKSKQLTPKQNNAIESAVKAQIAIYEKEHALDVDAMILYALHTHLGFGKDRLKKFFDAFINDHKALIAHYEMPDDGAYLSRVKLKEIGVDVEEWNKEYM